MTAEAVVMNKSAVALAADSAVTLGGGKVFNTANKVFALSKYEPVGLMIYGNAEFMGVPWETLVKMFRSQLGRRKCDTLDGYASLFVGFLTGMIGPERPFSEEVQHQHFIDRVGGLFMRLLDAILAEVQRLLSQDTEPSDEDVGHIAAEVIGACHLASRQAGYVQPMTADTHRELRSQYRSALRELRASVFQRIPLSPATVSKLYDVGTSLFTKVPSEDSGITSGLVIAGYGAVQVFPSLREYVFLGVVGGQLSFHPRKRTDIGRDADASIVPFAQGRDMIARFMEGVDPAYQEGIETSLRQVWTQSMDSVIDAISELTETQKECYKLQTKQAGDEMLEDYILGLHSARERYFWGPIMDVVAALPKDELAEMAESLVNLTSLKMRISSDKETVGGPIDVAVISKGDGLVWIKRKHYFRAELNPQFLANYHRENDSDDTKDQPHED